MASLEELIRSLEQAGEEFASFIEKLSDEDFHRRPGPEEWSAAELTGHVSEFPATFSGQARRSAENPGSVMVGRELDDPGRLAAVEKLAGAGPAEAAAAVRDGIRQAMEIVRAIPAEGWEAKAQHRRYGEVTVREMIERFLLSHLRDHLHQAKAAVGSAASS